MMEKLFFLLLTTVFMVNLQAQDVVGDWYGKLKVPSGALRIVFHIQKSDNGLVTTMDSPDQGANGLPTGGTTFENGKLSITAPSMGIAYEGKLDATAGKIEGIFKQGGAELPLVLENKEVKSEQKGRPQDPKSFPYKQEEIKVHNKSADVYLAGTLTLPENKKPESVVVLISGSGPQNRNEELLNHRPFLVLSDYLTRRGIGVLRFDDRGVAESTGDHATATSADFATDVTAIVKYLKSRADLKGVKIGLAGHSEGGMIAPMVAAEQEEVEFIVLLAGPGIEIKELMLLQTSRSAKLQGVDQNLVDINTAVLSDVYDYMKANSGKSLASISKGVKDIMRKSVNKFPAEVQKGIGDVENFVEQESALYRTPWFQYFINYDPASVLKKVTCPVLALNGSLDYQVTAKENLAGIEKALKKGGNTNFTIEELEGLNHLFQKAKTGSGTEYAQIEETFNEGAMKIVADWIEGQASN